MKKSVLSLVIFSAMLLSFFEVSNILAIDRPFEGWNHEGVIYDYGPEVREDEDENIKSKFYEGMVFRTTLDPDDAFRALYNLEAGEIRRIGWGDGLEIEVHSEGADRAFKYTNLFDDGPYQYYLREYELVDVDDERDKIREPDTIETVKLCQEENLGDYVIVYLDENHRPVHALAEREGIRVPNNISEKLPCRFTQPGPGFMAEITTDTEDFEYNISGESPPQMPSPVFEVTTIPQQGGGISYEWELEMRYDEGNYSSFADSVVRITETVWGDTEWQPDFEDTLAGGEIEVRVTATRGAHSTTTTKGDYAIKGENPEVEAIENRIEDDFSSDFEDYEDDYESARAMVWQESADFGGVVTGDYPHQFFDGEEVTEPAMPLRSFDNGWGLTQLTTIETEELGVLLTRNAIWNWMENIASGLEFFTHGMSLALERYINFPGLSYEPDIWNWDPTDPEHIYDGSLPGNTAGFNGYSTRDIIWIETYTRYNSAVPALFTGDGVFRDFEGNQEACTNAENYTTEAGIDDEPDFNCNEI